MLNSEEKRDYKSNPLLLREIVVGVKGRLHITHMKLHLDETALD